MLRIPMSSLPRYILQFFQNVLIFNRHVQSQWEIVVTEPGTKQSHSVNAAAQFRRGYRSIICKQIYRLKEDQAFSFSLELGRKEKVLRLPSADFLPPPPFVYDGQ